MDLTKIGAALGFQYPQNTSVTPVQTGYGGTGGGVQHVGAVGTNEYGGINFTSDTLARLDAIDAQQLRPRYSEKKLDLYA